MSVIFRHANAVSKIDVRCTISTRTILILKILHHHGLNIQTYVAMRNDMIAFTAVWKRIFILLRFLTSNQKALDKTFEVLTR